MISWIFCSPQNLNAPVPPILNLPWTKGILILFVLAKDSRVIGMSSGVCPSLGPSGKPEPVLSVKREPGRMVARRACFYCFLLLRLSKTVSFPVLFRVGALD